MPRTLRASVTFTLVALLLVAGIWLTSGRPVSAQAPERTPIAATQTAQAAAARSGVAAIHLHAPGAPAAAWTVVQWQDALGGWHNVTGWRGDLDEGQQKIWWVLGKDFDTGPFRWVVYTNKSSSQVWGLSPAFTLPGKDDERLPVNAAP